MARERIQLERADDFTGGLNLRDDPFNLDKSETFELQNVDLGRRGGFSLRRGVATFINNNTNLSIPRTTHTFTNSAGTKRVMAISPLDRVQYWTGAAWTEIKAAVGAVAADSKVVEMRNTAYIISPLDAVHEWDGVAGATAALAALGPNDDLAAPNEGNFPRCHTAAVFAESMFAGNMVTDFDGAVNRPSRVRWSHPGKPEDWRANDWIDLDPDDENGQIRAMVPFGDRLLVFKDHAVYAIHGAPPAAFEQNNLTKKVGASFNGAVTVTEQGVYFWDTRTGAWFYDGSEFKWIFERLYKLIEDRVIDPDPLMPQSLAFFNQRLHCAVRWNADPYGDVDVDLVYDPYAGKEGAWVIHVKQDQAEIAPFNVTTLCWPKALHVHVDATGVERLLGCPCDVAWIFELDTPLKFTDDFPTTGTHEIPAFYTTRWFDAGVPAQKKRWKRPLVVMRGGVNQTTNVEVLADYDPTTVDRSFNLITTVDSDPSFTSHMELNGLDEEAFCENDTFNPTKGVFAVTPGVNQLSRAFNIAAYTAPAGHGIQVGDRVVVNVADATYNGSFVVTGFGAFGGGANEINWTNVGADDVDAGAGTVEWVISILIGVDIDPTTIGPAIQTLAADWATDFGLNLGRYLFQIDGAGFLRLITSPDGTAASQLFHVATAPLPDANRRTVWVEFNPNDGLGNRVTKFYTSSTITGTKAQLGATVTVATPTKLFDGGHATEIGLHGFGGLEEFTGNIYAAEFRYRGIGGEVWGQPNFSTLAAGTEEFEDPQGNLWILSSGATIISTIINSDQGVWDTDTWDTFLWARETALRSERSDIVRGPPLGGGVARALRFKNMTEDQPWRVHGLTMKWIPRRIRN